MQTRPRPAALLAAAVLVGLQGVLVAGLGGYQVVAGVFGDPDDPANAEVGGALILAAGAGLLLVARGLARARRWSRAPAVLVQVLCLPVGWGLVQGDRPLIGLPLLLVALAALVLLFLPVTGEALEGAAAQAPPPHD